MCLAALGGTRGHDSQPMGISIREASAADWPQIWRILEPVFRAGETYIYAPDITEQQAHHAWMEIPARTFVCTRPNGELVGTYYLKANQPGQVATSATAAMSSAPLHAGWVSP